MSRWNLAWLLGLFAVTLLGLSLSYSAPSDAGGLKDKHENVNLLIDVIEEVQHKYVKDLNKEQMRAFVEDMINGGLQRLDPHSSFINEEEMRYFQQHSEGKFGGIGIRIFMDRNGQIVVDSPMAGTPAYKAGIVAGDIILKVDGKSTEFMNQKEVAERIQGDPDTKVTLTVMHPGRQKPEDIEITRAVIAIDSVLGDVPLTNGEKGWEYMIDKENKIAYVRITGFTKTTVDELIKVVENLQEQGMKGLILDLRNNPGGLLESAVQVSSMFLPPGEVVVSTKGRNQRERVFRSSPPNGMTPVLNTPMVVLLNRYSASASEIVAAALKDHLRAIVIGERSYGKGSVQNIIDMENGKTALKLTMASYWRPSGMNIHRFPDSKEEDDWGVKPNDGYEVKLTNKELIDYFEYRQKRDVLRSPPNGKASEPSTNEGKNGKQATKDGKKKEPFVDRVLNKALETLRDQLQHKAVAPAQGGAAAPPQAGASAQEASRPRRVDPYPAIRKSIEC